MSEEYYVEAIRSWRYNYREKRREFLIKWQNYSEDENTWEPEDNLSCPDILRKFIDGLSDEERRRCNRENPEKLNGFDRNATYKRCVGADGPHSSDEEGDESKKKEFKEPFYLLINFEDSDLAEEATLKEFYSHQPEECLKFFESRILVKPKNQVGKSGEKDGA